MIDAAVTSPTVPEVGAALARTLGYLGLVLLTGAALVARLGGSTTIDAASARRLQRYAVLGALLTMVAAALRAYWQAAAIVDPGAPVTMADLRLVALGTRWGGRWQLQALAAVVAATLVIARPNGWSTLVAAGLTAATIPLTGHAIAHGNAVIAVGTQALHACAGAAWFGTLTVLFLETRRVGLERLAVMWDRFSWLARAAVALVVITGIARAWDTVTSLDVLTTTPWGGALLAKIALVAAAALTGLLNWRRVLPAARTAGAITSTLRLTIGLELALAALVLILTGWLTGLPR